MSNSFNVINLDQIKRLTIEFGEDWGYAHVARILKLIEMIGADIDHDAEALTYAAYLHDWGAFPSYRLPGVDHALRSRQVAEAEILPRTTLSHAAQSLVAEAIELHDYRDSRPHTSIESLLLREADWLDMLGVIGLVREFAWGPNNLQICYDRTTARLTGIAGRLILPKSQELAQQRILRMKTTLAYLDEESFGILGSGKDTERDHN